MYLFIKDYLDSLGYFDISPDTVSDSKTIILILSKRCVIKKEDIIFRSPLRKDITLPLPSASAYPCFYNAGEVKKRADNICKNIIAYGYPFTSIVTDIVPINQNTRDTVIITYYVEPDDYYLFAPPILKGDLKTRKEILLNDIIFKEGEPFSHLVIENSLKRLNSRSYINSATALPPVITTSEDSVRRSKKRYISVPFMISDKYGMGLDGAISFGSSLKEKDRLYGRLTFDFVNLFHIGESAHFSYIGDEIKQEINLQYLQPYFLMQPLMITLNGGIEVANEKYGYFDGAAGILFEPATMWYSGLRIVGTDVTKSDSVNGLHNTFIGTDILILKNRERYEDKKFSTEFYLSAGSGFSRQNRFINRSHIDFKAGLHIPLPLHIALVFNLFTGNILTKDTLLTIPEMYQIGGSKSIRGYLEKEFSFTNVFYVQSEYHFYFRQTSSAYFFCDVGIGGKASYNNENNKKFITERMLGYGVGARVPSLMGILSIELARNIFDSKKTLGRIHLRFQSPFSSEINNIFSK